MLKLIYSVRVLDSKQQNKTKRYDGLDPVLLIFIR